MPDVIYGVTWNGNNVLNYTYDSLGRLTDKTVILNESEESNLNTTYEYYDVDDTKTTTLLKSVTTLDVPYTYEYDELGNITEINIKDGELSSYEYDELNQLVRENSVAGNKTYTYQYVNGNIKYKHEYAYTTGTLPATPIKTTEYHYEDSTWSDVLTKITETTYSNTNTSTNTYSLNGLSDESTSFDALAKSILGNNYQKVDLTANALVNVENNDLGNLNMNIYSTNSETINSTTLFEIESDEIGNFTNINGVDFNWNGRRLESISQEGTGIISYEYNIDGQRVSKTVTDLETNEVTTTEYFYNGSILAGQKTGDNVLVFMYDNNGDVFGFIYNGTPYYYVKNAQNDVWLITDENGQAVILYFYDAWGKVMGCLDGTDFGLATINPILYRSYYADLETGLYMYYLNSRYYVADWGRFISADSYVQTGQGILSNDMFAYCMNNPIMFCDPNGCTCEITIPAIGRQKPNIQNGYIITYTSNDDGIFTYTATPISNAGNSSSGDLNSQQTHENAQIVYALLIDKGWSENAIYAVLGNMHHESKTINPGRYQDNGGSGYGIVQWDPASKYTNWAEAHGYAYDSLVGQVEYLAYSMQPGKREWFLNSSYPKFYLSYSNFITSSKDVDYLTEVFVWSYERPGVGHVDRRVSHASYWANYFC